MCNRAPLYVFGIIIVLPTLWLVAVFSSYSLSVREHQRAQKEREMRIAAELALPGSLKASLEAYEQQRAVAEKEERATDNKRQFWFNLVVAAAAIASAVFVFFQLRINRRQLSTQQAELRAYVSFKLTIKWPDPGQPYQINFVCTNHGVTPALGIGFRGGVWHLPRGGYDFPLPEIAPGFDEGRLDLFPGETNRREIRSNSQSVFTAEQIDQADQNTHVFVIGLRIRYKDVFGKEHETQEYAAFARSNGDPYAIVVPGSSRIT